MDVCVALHESRTVKNKSQEFMALELGVARKTVQNWERGISEPTIGQCIAWFKILGINPLPYLFQVLDKDMEGLKPANNVEHLKKHLLKLIDQMPEEGIRQLLFLFYGEHGSSPRAVMNLVTAHLNTPMRDRVVQSSIIYKNYEIAAKKGKLTNPNNIQPNLELLRRAINMGEEAELSDKSAYVLVEDRAK